MKSITMSKYLDFEDEKWQKGYKPFYINRDNCKANIGKKVCFLLSRDYDRTRGYMHVRYGTIQSTRYSQLILSHGDSIDMRDVLEAGIEIE